MNNKLDDKGRVPIPQKFREVLRVKGDGDERVVFTVFGVGGVPCLEAYPVIDWQILMRELDTAPDKFSAKRLLFETVYLGGGEKCAPDKQGRIIIPQALRELAKLKSHVSFVGVGSKFRVFSKEGYEQVVQEFVRASNDPEGDGFSGVLG